MNEHIGEIKAIGSGSGDIKDEDGVGFAIDFESDEPLVCKIDGSTPPDICESCQ